MKNIVTKKSLQSMINSADSIKLQHIIGRALVVIHNNQTADEQNSNQTTEHNGRGFTGADAYSGSLTAKSYLKNKALVGWQVEKWTKPSKKTGYSRICKYHAQLNTAACAKLKQKA